MKKIVIIILVISSNILLFIGEIFLGVNLDQINKLDCVEAVECPSCNCNIKATPKYETYKYIKLPNKYQIISSSSELNLLLDSVSENNPYNASEVNKIRTKYKNQDFSNSQLLFINSSGSGCGTSTFPEINGLEYKDNIINIYLEKQLATEPTCDQYIGQIYLLQIEKGNYTEVIFTNQ